MKYSKKYIDSLQAENNKLKGRAADMEAKLAEFDDIDPDEYRQLKANLTAGLEEELTSKGRWDVLRARLTEQHREEVEALEERLTEAQNENRALAQERDEIIFGHEVTTAIEASGAINPDLVKQVVNESVYFENTKDGNRTIGIVDEDGSTKFDAVTGKPYTVQALIDEMKQSDEYGHLFGDGKSEQRGEQVNPWKKETRNLTQQTEIQRTDPALAEQLQREALPHTARSIDVEAVKRGERPATNPWHPASRNLTLQGAIMKANPQLAAQLKAEAQRAKVVS